MCGWHFWLCFCAVWCATLVDGNIVTEGFGAVSTTDDTDTWTIRGDTVVLDTKSTSLPDNVTSLVVHADKVIVAGDLSLPGKNVQIFSRQLSCVRPDSQTTSMPVTGQYADASGTNGYKSCQAQNLWPLTREGCRDACGSSFKEGLWLDNPGCFRVVQGLDRGSCRWNTNPDARTYSPSTRPICDAYPCLPTLWKPGNLSCTKDCLRDNQPFHSHRAAWIACASTAKCTKIIKVKDNEYYLYKDDHTFKESTGLTSYMDFDPNLGRCSVCSIDVSGENGRDADQRAASKGQNGGVSRPLHGSKGQHGAHGDDGQHGGSIKLSIWETDGAFSLTAYGGNGGIGQPGGAGGDGAHNFADPENWKVGTHCAPTRYKYSRGAGPARRGRGTIYRNMCRHGHQGGNGGNGGSAGDPGRSGVGGDGGTITVHSLCELMKAGTCDGRPEHCQVQGQRFCRNSGAWSFSASRGLGGKPAKPSPGGRGGHPAEGTHAAIYDERRKVCKRCDGQPQGPRGHYGVSGASSRGRIGMPGQHGSVYLDSGKSAHLYDAQRLQRQFQEARRCQMSGNVSEATSRLVYTAAITMHSKEVASINSKSVAWLERIGLGLDYFGRPPFWVPILSVKVHDEMLEQFLKLGAVIETSYLDWNTRVTEEKKKEDAIKDVIQQTEEYAEILRQQLFDIEKDMVRREKLLDRLELERQLLHSWLQVSIQKLSKTVTAQLQKEMDTQGLTSFVSVLQIIAGIFVISHGNIQGVVLLWPGIESLSASKRRKEEERRVVHSVKLVPEDADLAEVTKIWDQIQSEAGMGAGPMSNGNPAHGKIVMPSVQWRHWVEPYLDLPAGNQYTQAFEAYTNICDTYNKAQIDYSALYHERNQLYINIEEIHQPIVEARSQVGRPDQGLHQYEKLITNAYFNTRESISKLTAEQLKAQEYATLIKPDFVFEDRSIALLAGLQDSIRQARHTQALLQGAVPSQFLGSGISVVINKDTFPEAFSTPPRNNSIMFKLPLDHEAFQGMADVRVSKVRVWIDDFPNCQALWIRIGHSGAANFLTPAGKEVMFQHASRAAHFAYDYDSQKPFVDGNFKTSKSMYADLSPFTLWTIKVDQKRSRPKIVTDACGCTEGTGFSSGTKSCTPSSSTSQAEAEACAKDPDMVPFNIASVKSFRMEFFGTFFPLEQK